MRLEHVTNASGLSVSKCIALAIDRATGSFACSIYEARPQVCRDLERGSGACRGELAAKSDRARRALMIVRA